MSLALALRLQQQTLFQTVLVGAGRVVCTGRASSKPEELSDPKGPEQAWGPRCPPHCPHSPVSQTQAHGYVQLPSYGSSCRRSVRLRSAGNAVGLTRGSRAEVIAPRLLGSAVAAGEEDVGFSKARPRDGHCCVGQFGPL